MKKPGKTIVSGIIFLIALILYSPSFGQEATPLSKAGIHLIPYPQKVDIRGADFTLENGLAIILDKKATENDKFTAAELARYLQEELNIKTSILHSGASGKSIILTREMADKKSGDQKYDVTVDSDGITIRSMSETGLFYGMQTLLQLIQKKGSVTYVKGMKIVDWPDTKVRAAHYDTKHHQDTRAYVESFIRDLAKYKINMLVWEWEDKFAYPSHPEIGAPGAFTMEEMQAMTRYARKYHIQIVPLVQGLGHASFILKWPQYAHLREIPASNFEFNPLAEGAYKLLFDLWEDAIKATPGSEYIHIGSDETFELGLGASKQKGEEIGKSGLYHLFVGKSSKHLQEKGRKVIVWERPMGWAVGKDKKIDVVPQKGLILAESYSYETPDFAYAKAAKANGYSVYAYDPNPGIEQLFLPYFFRKNDDGEKIMGSLENSYNFLISHLGKGVFDGLIRTSWDDSGLPMQAWMMAFAISAQYSWNASQPSLGEFTAQFFKNRYGDDATDMEKLFMLLNEGAYFYMESFERKVWAWGNIGKTHIPDLPRGDALEYDPFWNTEYAARVKEANVFLEKMNQALTICNTNLDRNIKNRYDIEIFKTLVELIKHTTLTYQDLSALENAITDAHKQHFISRKEAFHNLSKAEKIIQDHLKRRERVFNKLVSTWEKTRLPKGMSTKDKEYFFEQDQTRHFANRVPDMTYLIINEQQLGLEEYLEKLQKYMQFYRDRFLSENK